MRKLLSVLLVLFGLGSVFATPPWDFLRGPLDIISLIAPIVIWVFLILSFAIMLISLLALKKTGSKRVLLVSGAFGLFFLKSILSLIDFYFSPGIFMNFAVQGLFDMLIIACLFTALLWRK